MDIKELLDGKHKEIELTDGFELVGKVTINDLVYLKEEKITTAGGNITFTTNEDDGVTPVGFITQLPSEKNGNTLGAVLFGESK